jgi:hypothetical protein
VDGATTAARESDCIFEQGSTDMQRLRFPIAVALTSMGLVALLIVAGGLFARQALAGGLGAGAWGFGPPWADHRGPGFALPAELRGLADLPADQRFAHFKGVEVRLADKDGRPLTVGVTPGTVTAGSAASLTIAANDGSTRTFTLDAATAIRGKAPPAQGDKVVVMALNGAPAAQAVFVLGGDGVGPWGDHFGRGR